MNGLQLDQTAFEHLMLTRPHSRDADQQKRRRTTSLLHEMRSAGFDPTRDVCLINAKLRWAFFDHQTFRFNPHIEGVSFLSARLLSDLQDLLRQG